jgi:signal transduction histidine kinase
MPPDELASTAWQHSLTPFAADRYRAILHLLPQRFCVVEVLFDAHGTAIDYRFLEINPAFAQQTGLGNPVGRTRRELEPLHEAYWYELLGEVARTGRAAHLEQRALPTSDDWYEVHALPTGPPGSHQVALLFADITARKHAEQHQAFRLALVDALRLLLDADAIQTVAARLLGQHLRANQVHYGETQGDYVVIHQGYGDGLPAMVGRFYSPDFGECLTATHRAGIVQVVHDIETVASNTEAERQVLRQAGILAYITVPLVKAGQWVATLAVHSRTPRQWTVAEVHLVEEVAERTWATVERARAEKALRQREQQQALFEAIQGAQQEERRRIAESLHDGLGQLLYATKLQLDRLPTDPAQPARQEAARLLGEAIGQVRAIAHELSSALLEEFGLQAALETICQQLSGGGLRWQCHIEVAEPCTLPLALQQTVYRLAQSLAHNVAKHAQASWATLEVEALPGWVIVRVEDNGQGFDPLTVDEGMGLKTARSRVALLSGILRLESTPGQGTHIRIRLPVN